MTSQGHPRTVFKRALQHENLLVAEATAREIGRVSLVEALELTALVARKEPHRHGRYSARWLRRYLEEHERTTISEVALVVLNLCALASSSGHDPALAILREAVRNGHLDRRGPAA